MGDPRGSRGAVPRDDRSPPSLRREGADASRASLVPADPGRQRDLGRLHGRGQHDRAPGPRERQDQHASRARTGTRRTWSGSCAGTWSRTFRPPSCWSDSWTCTAASPGRRRSIIRRCRPPSGRSRRGSEPFPSPPGRGDPYPSSRCSPRRWTRRPCSWGSGFPTTGAHSHDEHFSLEKLSRGDSNRRLLSEGAPGGRGGLEGLMTRTGNEPRSPGI